MVTDFPPNFVVERAHINLAVADDGGEVGRIKYVGDPADAPDPQVYIHATNEDLIFYLNFGTGAVVDTTIGTGVTGTYAFDLSGDETYAELKAVFAAQTNAAWELELHEPSATMSYDSTGGTEETALMVLPIATDSVNAMNCRNEIGTILRPNVSNSFHNILCMGLEGAPETDPDGKDFGFFQSRKSYRQTVGAARDVANQSPVKLQLRDRINFISRIQLKPTFGSGVATAYVYAVNEAGTHTLIWSENNAAATTVERVHDELIFGPPGSKLVVICGGGVTSACPMQVNGGWGYMRQ